ncbi:MAG: C25 family cysteine peptidase [Bacteroidales bacterium]|nr:C25 family cysteine peptidase [Bacteroidales bacterium]
MKKNTLVIIMFLLVAFGVNAQQFSYPDSWGKAGFNLVDTRTTNVQVIYSVPNFSIEDFAVNGETMKNIMLPGSFLFNDAGMPNLPGKGTYIAIPQGSTPKLKIVSMRSETIHNVNIMPAPVIPAENDDSPIKYNKNMAVYSQNALYPAEPVKMSNVEQIRGVDVVLLGVTPFQYNPVTKDLIVYKDIKIDIDFEGGNGEFGNNAYRSRWFDPIVKDQLLNPSVLPNIDYDQRMQEWVKSGRNTTECEYIILSPTGPDFLRWADSLANWRNQQGILTHVYSLDEIGGNTTTAIETFINNAYNTWTIKPVAVLMLGDYGTDGTKSVISVLKTLSGETFPSDHVFADVNNDDMAELVFGRIVANNNDQLSVICSKQLNYERNPPMDTSFYQHPITALGWATDRWFQICSEVVGGYFKHFRGRNPVRINEIYSGNPSTIWSSATNTSTVVNYFGPNGLSYIPATPAEMPCCWTGGTATKINEAIESGAFILQHRDHGNETGWGEPDYSNSNITPLSNTRLPFVFSINCLTGKYNWSNECFAEKFIRHSKNGVNAGALGLVCPSEVSYSFVNDTFVWGMYDNMWPSFMPAEGTQPDSRGVCPAFGMVAGKYFLKRSGWPYNTGDKLITYYLFHMHGDTFLKLFDTVPQNLTVSHASQIDYGTTTFTVTATDSAFIALTVDNQILATAYGDGTTPVIISIPVLPVGTNMLVTVTKQNYLRYHSTVTVTSVSLVVDFSASSTALCKDGTTNFTDLTNITPETWAWEFPGGTPSTSNVQNPTGIQYSASGNYDVTLTVTKAGVPSSTLTKNAYILVTNYPIAAFTTTGTCVGSAIQFTDNTNPNGGVVDRWEWNFGDPTSSDDSSTLQNPTHIFASTGPYTVTLNAYNSGNCGNAISQVINIIGAPGIAAQPTGTTVLCKDATGIEYTTTGATDAASYTWMTDPENAGTFVGNAATASLNLTTGFTGAFKVMVKGINECGEGAFSEGFDVNVIELTAAPSKPVGVDSVDVNKIAQSEFTITEVPGADSYSWTLIPIEAGTISGIGTTGTAIWATEYKGVANITTKAINICGESIASDPKKITVYSTVGIRENKGLGIEIFPNPNSGKFKLDITSNSLSKINIFIYNVLGSVVYNENDVRLSSKLLKTIDISALPNGIYHLKIEGEDTSVVKRIIIEK